jgi:hypothetical protein
MDFSIVAITNLQFAADASFFSRTKPRPNIATAN